VNCDENIPPEAELELFAVVGAVLELCVEGDCSAGGEEPRLNEPEQEGLEGSNPDPDIFAASDREESGSKLNDIIIICTIYAIHLEVKLTSGSTWSCSRLAG
jgi:hypothetical protein